MATLRDIAKKAGVSTAAVSLYINGKGKGRISPATGEKIRLAIETLEYRPSQTQTLLHKMTDGIKTVAIYWASDIRASLLGEVMAGIQECIQSEYLSHLNIVIRPYKINELYKEKELLQSNYYDGVIISNTSSMDMQYLDTIQPPAPTVLLNRYSPHYNTVMLDNPAVGRSVAQMIKDHGFTSAAIFRTMDPFLGVNQRLLGFIDGCRGLDVQIPNEAQFIEQNSVEGGMEAARQFLMLSDRPSVIFADTDWLALGSLYIFHKAGIKIPEDVSIIAIGQNVLSAARCSIPALSTLDIPLRSLASNCLSLLSELMYSKVTGPIHRQIQPELHLRESFL